MSEEAGEKAFDATPARRERAKREGNAARSTEAAGVAAFAGGLLALVVVLPLLGALAAETIRVSNAALAAGGQAAIVLVACGFVPAAGAACAATLASLAQSGGLHVTPLKFALSKLAAGPGLKRMFGGEALVGAARAVLGFTVVVAAVTPIVSGVVAASITAGSPVAAAQLARDGMLHACFAAVATGALFALADYALARRRWLHGLRMTFDAFKRDLKEQDGDPQAKSRRKQFHRTLTRGGIARTREASFVVVNPTHIAVAMRYAPPAVPVPEILVRACDERAREVRSIAERAGIPVVENVPLARLLYEIGHDGQPIPAETFVAVAEVIAVLVRAGLFVA